MLCTRTYTLDMGPTLTFPADYIQRQIPLLTLAARILLSLTSFNTRNLSWNTLRPPPDSHNSYFDIAHES